MIRLGSANTRRTAVQTFVRIVLLRRRSNVFQFGIKEEETFSSTRRQGDGGGDVTLPPLGNIIDFRSANLLRFYAVRITIDYK